MILDKLISVLESFGFPVRRQGTLLETEAYPEHFFTFWNSQTQDGNHYDNTGTAAVIWTFDVNFYSTNPVLLYEVLGNAAEDLRKAGFLVPGNGYDIGSDEVTHTGRGIEVIYYEKGETQNG